MILVTGATGTIGSRVVANLKATDEEVCAFVRSEAGGRELDVPFWLGDFAHAGSVKAALQGVERAFLASPASEAQPALEASFIEAAASAGVKHVVKLSSLGAELGPSAPVRFQAGHARSEAALAASGLGWTSIRPASFMERLLGHVPTVRESDTIAAPMGHGRVAYVDARDVAEFAAAVLRDPAPHAGAAYPLTGPAAVSMPEVAELLSDLVGRHIRYADVSEDRALAELLESGVPRWSAEGRIELWRWYRTSDASLVSPVGPVLLGKPARTLPAFLEEHRALFT